MVNGRCIENRKPEERREKSNYPPRCHPVWESLPCAHINRTYRWSGAEADTLLCVYKIGEKWFHVTSNQVARSVKWLAKEINLESKGFPSALIGSHSLRAGGAMALKLNGIDVMLIKKYGRWSRDTFLTCTHEQIAGLATGVSKTMAREIKFYNIAGFDHMQTPAQDRIPTYCIFAYFHLASKPSKL